MSAILDSVLDPQRMAEVRRWDGVSATEKAAVLTYVPRAGCLYTVLPLGQTEVEVEYEVIEAEAGGWDEPSYAAEVSIIAVLVNGTWIDSDCIATEVVQGWAERIAEGLE